MTTRNTLMTLAMLAFSTGVASADTTTAVPANPLDHISAEAKKTEAEAKEISSMLRSKRPNFDLVNEKMDLLEKHVAAVRDLVVAYESGAANLTEAQKKELDRMRVAATVNDILVTNKKNLLASNDKAKQRSLLRAKAEGIAHRARVVQTSAVKIRS